MSQAAPESFRPWAGYTAEGSRSLRMKQWPSSRQYGLHLLTWKNVSFPSGLWSLARPEPNADQESLELLLFNQASPTLQGAQNGQRRRVAPIGRGPRVCQGRHWGQEASMQASGKRMGQDSLQAAEPGCPLEVWGGRYQARKVKGPYTS